MTIPACDIDFYSDAVIADPYPHYQAMRDRGPVVHLPQHDAYAITRYTDVRDALRNEAVFICGEGVMMNDPVNTATRDQILCADGPLHKFQRQIIAKPLMPAGIAELRTEIERLAKDRVDELVVRGRFDGVSDFAQYLPLMVVSYMVGLPEAGRERLLHWASAIFDTIGTINARFLAAVGTMEESRAYLDQLDPAMMRRGSWGANLFAAAARGEITDAAARGLMFSYVAPSLDTTINATSSALWLLGTHPEQWDLLRADPTLIAPAIEEAMRLETPIRAFSRMTVADAAVDGVTLPKGSRVLLVYASANRDERYWQDADQFDIRRKAPQEQLAFGTGVHMCVGMHLARLEMRSLFNALAARVKRFSVADETRELHNVLRGLKSVAVTIEETDD